MTTATKRKAGDENHEPKRLQLNPAPALSDIPDRPYYRYSYPDESQVACLSVCPGTGVLVLGTVNGTISFWARCLKATEYEKAKSYPCDKGHQVRQLVSNKLGTIVTSLAEGDTQVKVFEVVSLDMLNTLTLPFQPGCMAWFETGHTERLAVSDKDTGVIYLLDINTYGSGAEGEEGEGVAMGLEKIQGIHKSPVVAMVYNDKYQCMVSTDSVGMIEYWSPIKGANYAPPSTVFKLKSQTNLYDLRKSKAYATALVLSPDSETFLVRSVPDGYIRVFSFSLGKCLTVLDESPRAAEEAYALSPSWLPETMPNQVDFAERLRAERETIPHRNMVLSETGEFLVYATCLGVKVHNLRLSQCVRLLGADESLNFKDVAYIPSGVFSQRLLTIEMASATNELISKEWQPTPTIFSTATTEKRLYAFDRDDGVPLSEFQYERDRLKGAGETSARAVVPAGGGTAITLHTSMGDIRVRLHPQFAPLACENFNALCRKNYYNGTIFHRVVKGFMVQAGDPTGTGTGGESSFKDQPYFRDEFSPLLRHNKPFILSMANAGPDTNGSQFFLTTARAPWLDDKHTIFGEVESGEAIIRAIENLDTDTNDKPIDPPVIINTSIWS